GEVTRELTEDFLQVSVIEGSGKIEIEGQFYAFSKGSHFIIPHTVKTYALHGQAVMIVSHVLYLYNRIVECGIIAVINKGLIFDFYHDYVLVVGFCYHVLIVSMYILLLQHHI